MDLYQHGPILFHLYRLNQMWQENDKSTEDNGTVSDSEGEPDM